MNAYWLPDYKYWVCLLIYIILYKDSKAEYQQDTLQVNKLNTSFDRSYINSPSLAFDYANRALAISNQIKYAKGAARSEYNLGLYFIQAGKDHDAINHLKNAINILKGLNLKKMTGSAMSLIGNEYFTMGNLDSAGYFYRNSLEYLEKAGDAVSLTILYNSIGRFYEAQGNLDTAFGFYKRAENLIPILGQKDDDVGYTYRAIGNILLREDKKYLALQYYNEAVAAYYELGNISELATTYTNLGIVWSDSGNYAMALESYNKALSIKQQLKDKRGIVEALVNLGILFNDRTEKEKDAGVKAKDYDTALKDYNEALAIAQSMSSKELIRDIYKNISSTYANLGKYDSAFTYGLKYDSLNEIWQSEKNGKAMADMLAKYHSDQKEAEAKNALALASARQRQFYIASASFAVIIFLATIIFLFYRQRVRTRELIAAKNEQISNQKIDELLQNQEIKSFQSMIEGQEQERKRIAEDLHDGLGILLSTVKLHFGAIEDKLDKQNQAQEQYVKGAALLDEALGEVRRIAHNMSTGILTNIGLTPALEDLKQTIEASRKIKVNLFVHNMETRLETQTEISVYRIIQELVGNTLKHANATEISINLNRDTESKILTVMVEDDGSGFDTSAEKGSKGMGLGNIKSRAERLGGTFNMDSTPDKGTTAIIEIPVS